MAIHTDNTAISALTLAGTAAAGSLVPGIAAAQDGNALFDNATLSFDLGYVSSDFSKESGFPSAEDKFGKDSGLYGKASLSAPIRDSGWDWSVSGALSSFGSDAWTDTDLITDEPPFDILRTFSIAPSASMVEIDLDVGRTFEAGQASIRAAGGLRLAQYSQTFDKGITSEKVGFDDPGFRYDGDFQVDMSEKFEGAGPVIKLAFDAPLNPANGIGIVGGLAYSQLKGDNRFTANGWVYTDFDGAESVVDESSSESAEWISQSAYLALTKSLANGSTIVGGVRVQSVRDEDWRDDYSIDSAAAFVGMNINF